MYDNDPEAFRQEIRDVKSRIAKFPQLRHLETFVDEWNFSLDQIVPAPGFQRPSWITRRSRL